MKKRTHKKLKLKQKIEENYKKAIEKNNLYKEKEKTLKKMLNIMHEENTILGIIGNRGAGKTFTTELAIKTFDKMNKKSKTIKLNLWQIFKEYDEKLETNKKLESKTFKENNKTISSTLWRSIFYKLGYFKFLKKWFILNAEFQNVETKLKLNAVSWKTWIALVLFAIFFIIPVVLLYRYVGPGASAISFATETALTIVSYFSLKINLKNNFSNMLEKGEYNVLISDLLNDKTRGLLKRKWINIHFEDLDRIKNTELKNKILQHISILYRNPKVNILIEMDENTYNKFSYFIKKQNNGDEEIYKLIPQTVVINNVTRETLMQEYGDESWKFENLNAFIDELYSIATQNERFSWRYQKSIEDNINHGYEFLKTHDNPNLSKTFLYNSLIKEWWSLENKTKNIIERKDEKWVVTDFYKKISKPNTLYEDFLNNINEFKIPKNYPGLIMIGNNYMKEIMRRMPNIEFIDSILDKCILPKNNWVPMEGKVNRFLFKSIKYRELFIMNLKNMFFLDETDAYNEEGQVMVQENFDKKYYISLWNSLSVGGIYESMKRLSKFSKIQEIILLIPVEYSNEISNDIFKKIIGDISSLEEIEWKGMKDENKKSLIERLLVRKNHGEEYKINMEIVKINKGLNKSIDQEIFSSIVEDFKEEKITVQEFSQIIDFINKEYPDNIKEKLLVIISSVIDSTYPEESIVKLINSINSQIKNIEWTWASNNIINSLIEKNEPKHLLGEIQKFDLINLSASNNLVINLFERLNLTGKELIFEKVQEELYGKLDKKRTNLYIFGNKQKIWDKLVKHNNAAINNSYYEPVNFSAEILERDLLFARKVKSRKNVIKLNRWIFESKEMLNNLYLSDDEVISMQANQFSNYYRKFKEHLNEWEDFKEDIYDGIHQNVAKNAENLKLCKNTFKKIIELSQGNAKYHKKIDQFLKEKIDINKIIEYILNNRWIPYSKKAEINKIQMKSFNN